MRILSEEEIRATVSVAAAVDVVEEAFAALSRGKAQLPPPIYMALPHANGEVHLKGAHLQGAANYVFKVASGFYDNPARGLSVIQGLVLVFSATTGEPVALLLDNGYLTDLRTGAAGGVAVRHLAAPGALRVGLVGAGEQARHQLRAIASVGEVESVAVWSRNGGRDARFAAEMGAELSRPVAATASAEDVVRDATVVVTATPSREPVVEVDWVQPGALVVAMGSDAPDKQELPPALLARADVVVADYAAHAAKNGEVHHALDAGAIGLDDVVELGAVITGAAAGRRADTDIVVCDLTGVGVQDAAIANLALTVTTG